MACSALMSPEDEKLLKALIHDANVRLTGDRPEDLGRENTLDAVKQVLRLAEKIAGGNASAEDRAAVADAVHPQVRSLYL